MRYALLASVVLAATLGGARTAAAWGDAGHRVIATIAYERLAPNARMMVDSILRDDRDKLTGRDFVSRATWADKVLEDRRSSKKLTYNSTRLWHYAEIEVTKGPPEAELERACFHFKRPKGHPASEGPARDCVLNKVEQFAEALDEVADPFERVVALKFLINLIGDLHQPLRVSQDFDLFGTTTSIRFNDGVRRKSSDLHEYWDNELVALLKTTPAESDAALAKRLLVGITSEEAREWSGGTPRKWILETMAVGRDIAYNLPKKFRTHDLRGATFHINEEYESKARLAVKAQLIKAGLRLARTLNDRARKVEP